MDKGWFNLVVVGSTTAVNDKKFRAEAIITLSFFDSLGLSWKSCKRKKKMLGWEMAVLEGWLLAFWTPWPP